MGKTTGEAFKEVKEAIEVVALAAEDDKKPEAAAQGEAAVIKAKADLLKSTVSMYVMIAGLAIICVLLLTSAFFAIYPEITGDEIELSDDTLEVLRIIKDIIASIVKFVV